MSSPNTSQEDILAIIDRLRETFESKVTLSFTWRIKTLQTLLELVQDDALEVAMYNDLHRSKFESNLLELDLIKHEIHTAINNLDDWMRPKSSPTNLSNLPALSRTKYDPLGTVIVMSPWNYPLLLTFQPLVGAIAAGNTCLLRPANYSDNVSSTILALIDKYFNPNPTNHNGSGKEKYTKGMSIGVVLGDRHVTDFVLDQQFDHIFFTGGPHLGKIVLSKAAKFLTPCTLELGGKSPAIIDKDSGDLDTIAKRLVWGAFLNAGQTCVRPDYVFCHESLLPKVLPLMRKYVLAFYGGYENNHTHINSGDDLEYHFMAGSFLLKNHHADQNNNNNNNDSINNSTTTNITPNATTTTSTTNTTMAKSSTEQDKLLEKKPNSSSSSSLSTSIQTIGTKANKSTIPNFNSLLEPIINTTAVNTDYGTFEQISAVTDQAQAAQDLIEFRKISNSPYYGRIINTANFNRLVNCLSTDSQYLYFGGIIDRISSFITPTVLHFPTYTAFTQSESMKEELFGPILPIVAFTDISSVINHIRKHPKPLALYCFSSNSKTIETIAQETSSGSLLINDAIVILASNLSFGGVGASGYGNYHGFASFETFSHRKSVMYKTTWFDIFARYPPYTTAKRRIFSGLHCIEGCGAKMGRIWSIIRRTWCDRTPFILQFLIIAIILGGLGCGFYWGVLPQLMKLMKIWVEKYYDQQCQ